MKNCANSLKILAKEKFQFIDITEKIKKIVQGSKIRNGIINIASRHTTTAILLNENELLLLKDFSKVITNIINECRDFEHNNMEKRKKICPELPDNECKNAAAHCRSIFLTNSQTLNIINRRLDLGRWQKIIFVELDKPKKREISIMVLGE